MYTKEELQKLPREQLKELLKQVTRNISIENFAIAEATSDPESLDDKHLAYVCLVNNAWKESQTRGGGDV